MKYLTSHPKQKVMFPKFRSALKVHLKLKVSPKQMYFSPRQFGEIFGKSLGSQDFEIPFCLTPILPP